jgi:hypothetical protein
MCFATMARPVALAAQNVEQEGSDTQRSTVHAAVPLMDVCEGPTDAQQFTTNNNTSNTRPLLTS